MNVLNNCILVFSLFASLTCTTKVNKFEPASYLGSKIPIPREVDKISDAPNKMIVLLDMITCPSCTLKSLNFWDEDLKYFNELNQESHNLDIIFIVNTKQDSDIDASLSRLNSIYPIKVFYDSENRFLKRFTPPVETQYHCFLIDESNFIRLIGYPYMNQTLKENYISIVFGS